jgi:hypothetical protein
VITNHEADVKVRTVQLLATVSSVNSELEPQPTARSGSAGTTSALTTVDLVRVINIVILKSSLN